MTLHWTLSAAETFPRLSEDWNALNQATANSPLLHADFVGLALRHFGEGDETVALAREDGRVVAGCILEQRAQGVWETFQPSQMPIGPWLQSAGLDMGEVFSSLIKALPGMSLLLAATQQDPDLLARPASGEQLETLDYIQTARVRVDRTFDAYWDARGKNLRHNMKRQRAKLETEGTALRLETIVDAQQVESAIADYGRLESAGWKAEGGTAIDLENVQGRFYRDLLEAFMRRGLGTIYRYWFNDQVVAVDLCVEGNGTFVVLKTTYDESIRTCSPALLMRQDAFRGLFSGARVERIEFYGKLMEWHTKWSEEARVMYHVNYHRWPMMAKVRRLLGRLKSRPADTPDTVESPST